MRALLLAGAVAAAYAASARNPFSKEIGGKVTRVEPKDSAVDAPAAPEGARKLWSDEVVPPPPHWFHSVAPFPINLLCPLPVEGNATTALYSELFAENPLCRPEDELRRLIENGLLVGGPIVGGILCIKDLYMDRYGNLLVSGCIRYRATRESGEIVKCFFYAHASLRFANNETFVNNGGNNGSSCGSALVLVFEDQFFNISHTPDTESFLLQLSPVTIPLDYVPGTGNLQADLLCILAQLSALKEQEGGNGGAGVVVPV
jgi:hypothetical protein